MLEYIKLSWEALKHLPGTLWGVAQDSASAWVVWLVGFFSDALDWAIVQFPEIADWIQRVQLIRQSINSLIDQSIFGLVAAFFPVDAWLKIIVSAFIVKMTIRAIRWLLACIPGMALGG